MSAHTQGWDGSDEFRHSDVFDSRDVVARVEWLEAEIADLVAQIGDSTAPDDFVSERYDLVDYRRELGDLKAFVDEVAGDVADWEYGETFISDDYFETYAKETAYDIGAVDRDAAWPANRIDWEAAADDLKMDYQSFELTLDGITFTYWAR